MQLVAYGAQDVYLTGNPQVTFFKQLYRRHTNFAMQSVEAQFNGSVGFGKRVSLVVPRVGDLMGKTYLEFILPTVELMAGAASTFTWTQELGHFLIENVEVQIGGQVIDKHYGRWLSIWYQLTVTQSKNGGYTAMILSDIPGITAGESIPNKIGWTPLQFWFCRHEGLALPLIALQYHEVRIVMQFETLDNLVDESLSAIQGDLVTVPSLDSASLYIDYIFLDTDERRKFAQTSHEYLIDQLQFTGQENVNKTSQTKIKLNFNHPVKELVWVVYSPERTNSQYNIDVGTFLTTNGVEDGANPVANAQLQFNGHDRFSVRDGRYFSDVQPYQHHTSIPTNAGVNVYSFALYPELEQPSGTANFSRIDNATLNLNLTATSQAESADTTGWTAYIYAVNYNVLRIMSGMGGLAYSN